MVMTAVVKILMTSNFFLKNDDIYENDSLESKFDIVHLNKFASLSDNRFR